MLKKSENQKKKTRKVGNNNKGSQMEPWYEYSARLNIHAFLGLVHQQKYGQDSIPREIMTWIAEVAGTGSAEFRNLAPWLTVRGI